MRRLVAGVLVVALLVAGAAPGLVSGDSGSRAANEANEANGSAPPDPDSDVIGWEAGYWYNESIDVDQSDGLSDAELEAYVARAMARVEYIREKEFEEPVPVSVRSREAHRNQSPVGNETNASYGAWNNQVWESLFIVGEDTDANAVLRDLYGTSVQGYYSPPRNEIVIISESGERTIDNATLVHELTHALQDQHYNLSRPRYTGQTQDDELAANGIVEGVASYVETRYAQKCADEWDCVTPPADGGAGGGSLSNYGIYLVLFHPYSDGPAYVNARREQGGWEAVNQSMRYPPNSTEQIIHVTNETPVEITVEDTATAGWQPFPAQGVNGTDTLGEASIYAMFWYQTRNYDAGIVNLRDFTTVEGPFDRYDYESEPSAGWAGDRVLPYRQTDGNESRYGYVWATEWDTRTDAEEFAEAYRAVLRAQGATRVGENTYRIPDGPYADAFHVSRNGTRVTVVNGPEVADLSEIRPGIEIDETTTTETTTTTTTESRDTNATTATTGTTISDGIPGFGVGVAVAALLALAGLAAIRRLNGGDR